MILSLNSTFSINSPINYLPFDSLTSCTKKTSHKYHVRYTNSTSINNVSQIKPAFAFKETFELVSKRFPAVLIYSVNGEWHIKVSPETLQPLLTFLKYHTNTSFNQLRDITAIDYSERKLRFEVVYLLLSLQTARRLIISVSLSEGRSLPSVTSLYASAGWYERETWDRFGMFFTGHPDLRRRLTDYGFKGHPLRKDFPLTGFVEVRYDDFRKRILYEGVSLPQEYRIFHLENPWATALLFLFVISFYFLFGIFCEIFGDNFLSLRDGLI